VAEISVEVLDATRRIEPGALAWLVGRIEAAVRHLGAVGEVRVRIVGDEEMAAAHEEFGGVAGTTDVLTFDLADPEAGVVPRLDRELGKLAVGGDPYRIDTDILACFDEAARQLPGVALGESGSKGVERELLLYAVHGVLHCLGMDDHDEAAAAEMHRVEDVVLTAIGVGPVYSGKTPGQGAAG
jgi:rRNA maturation RNase YbeY